MKQKPQNKIQTLTKNLARLLTRKKKLEEQQVKTEEALRLAHSEYLQIMDEIKNLT